LSGTPLPFRIDEMLVYLSGHGIALS
jgi:hypothetical protein